MSAEAERPERPQTFGRRCAMGCATWPDDERFKVCPACGQSTVKYRGVTPMDEDEANRYAFEAFYKEWDERMPDSRLLMTPEQTLKWDSLYPDGRPSEPDPADG